MDTFSTNSSFLYIITGTVVLFIIAQSLFFLSKAWKRARELGIDGGTLRRTVISSAGFTIAPAVSILLGVITLSRFLGLPLPWLRLSVVGALTYELPAASTAAAALGASIGEGVTDPQVFATIAWVMTLGIIPGIFYLPFVIKPIQRGILRVKKRDEKWGEIFFNALFIGMISAFLGVVFADTGRGLPGWIPVFVMLVSILLMILLGLIITRYNLRKLKDFALPICMLGAMALSIPITNLIVQ
ncbi:MAG: DUF5058 family protein [Spirochaetaceae bacterium]